MKNPAYLAARLTLTVSLAAKLLRYRHVCCVIYKKVIDVFGKILYIFIYRCNTLMSKSVKTKKEWKEKGKRMMKKVLAVLLTMGLGVSMLTGCGSSNTGSTEAKKETEAQDSAEDTEEKAASDGETYKIGVIQYVQHDALDSANEGFFAALDEAGISYEADQQNAAGEASSCQTIADTLVNNGNDLIFAIATPAAQAVSGVTSDIPIVLTAVTDPADAGLVADNEAPGGNVTGSSDMNPVKEQIELIPKILPEAKKVGILYCSAESNSVLQAELAKESCEAAGLEAEDYTVSSSNEIQTVVESMIGKVDAIYAPTDNMIAAGMSTVSMIATENKIPVICGESGMVREGGLVSYGVDYFELGKKAGKMAIQILTEGKEPAEMPVEYLSTEECTLDINQEVADELGIDVSVLK